MPSQPPIRPRDLVGRPLRVGAVEVATVTDIIASRDVSYVLGLEVRVREGQERFVPWVAAEHDGGSLTLFSVFALLSTSDLALYLDRGRRIGERDDVVIAGDGVLAPSPDRAAAAAGGSSTRRSTSSVQSLAKRSIP
jgi:hypothetical protein